MDIATPTASVFNKQRAKLKPDAFESVPKIFDLSVNSIAEISAYWFLATDGSTFTFFSKPSFASYEYFVTLLTNMRFFPILKMYLLEIEVIVPTTAWLKAFTKDSFSIPYIRYSFKRTCRWV
ncbi:MAG: hypothetical protein ACERKZ_03940 [Lachnotalea sp.]